MKWKKLLHKQNAQHYAWPPSSEGWDTAETIAEQLECSPERVREHLAPSIRSGEVEVKTFTIWDVETERKIQKVGFRSARKSQAPAPKSQAPAAKSQGRPDRWSFTDGAKIRRMDSPRIGVVKSGRIHWEDGKISLPSKSQQTKLRLAGK